METATATATIIYNVVAIWAGATGGATVMVSYRNEDDAYADSNRRNRDENAGGAVSYRVSLSELR